MNVKCYIVGILVSIILTGCSGSETNHLLDDKIISYTIQPEAKDNIIFGGALITGEVSLINVKFHKSSRKYMVYLKAWKSNNSLDIVLDKGRLKVFYTERETVKLEDLCVFFDLDIDLKMMI